MQRRVSPIHGLALLVALACAAASAEARRIALLVGVGEYGDRNVRRLEGPPNDVRALFAELTGRWGFAPADTHTLIDRQATREAILSELKALEGRSQSGDHLFVYFSGHGTSPYDPNRLPLPHSTGAFLPWDFPNAKDVSQDEQVQRLILGVRDVRPILSRLEEAGRELFVVSDSCYSGQAVRGLYADHESASPLTPRYTPLASRGPEGRDALEATPGLGSARKPEPYPYANVIYLAAASDSEPAVDIKASALAQYPTLDGKPHGAVTDALLRVLKGALPADLDRDGTLDYAEVTHTVQDFVTARGYGHTPRILPGVAEDRYGLATRGLFGGAPVPASARVQPIPVEETLQVRLEGVPGDLARRLRTERGVALVAGPAEVTLRAEVSGFRLLNPAQDQIGLAHSADAALGHIRQLAWAKRLRAIGERGRRGLIQLEANPAERGGTFIEGQRINFVLRSDRQVVLLLVHVDASGHVKVLYPNDDRETRPIPADKPTFVPGTGPYELIKVQEPFGADLLFAFGFEGAPAWLPEVMDIKEAPPGAERLLDLERHLREAAGGYAFGTLELRTVPRQVPP